MRFRIFGAAFAALVLTASFADARTAKTESKNLPLPPPPIAAEGLEANCFTLREDCTRFIVQFIDNAKSEILVQAYNYTSPPILVALGRAKAERNVDVRVILDKTNEGHKKDGTLRYTGATYTVNHSIPVVIDYKPNIAHNKVMIIDRTTVIGGSFNYTRNAEKNAENVTVRIDAPKLAQRYIENWQYRQSESRPFNGEAKPPEDDDKDDED